MIGKGNTLFFFLNGAFRDPAHSKGVAAQKMNSKGSPVPTEGAPPRKEYLKKKYSSPGQASRTSNQNRDTGSHTQEGRDLVLW